MTLTLELSKWEVRLKSGEVIVLFSNSFSREGEEYVFDILMEGSPNFLVDVARVPVDLVDNILTV